MLNSTFHAYKWSLGGYITKLNIYLSEWQRFWNIPLILLRDLWYFLRIFISIYHSPTFFRDLDVDEQFYSTFYFLKLCELVILIPTNCIILILPLFSCRKESPAETWGTFAHSCKGRWHLRAEETGMHIKIKFFMTNETILVCTFRSVNYIWVFPIPLHTCFSSPLVNDHPFAQTFNCCYKSTGDLLMSTLLNDFCDSWNVLGHDLVFYEMVGHVKDLIVSKIISLIILNNIWQFPAFLTSRQFRKLQNTRTKIHLPNRHS